MNEKTIGANLRRRRMEAGLTLTELAQRAGLTKGTLSKIETGKVSPPISTMLRIAEPLGTTLSELFTESEAAIPYALTRRGQGKLVSRDGSRFGYCYESLALELKHKVMEPFLLTIRPGDPQGVFQHGGQEFIYMLSGQIEFCVGEEALRLRRGDSLYFDPSLPHRTRIVGKKPARFLCLFIQSNSPSKPFRSSRGKT